MGQGNGAFTGHDAAKRLDQADVDSPPHYQANGIEAIDVIEAFDLNFHVGNAVKYLLRAGRKGGPEKRREDLAKAAWYIQRELERTATDTPEQT